MFAHALVRESLYDELSTSRRTRLHRRIGEALEQRPQPPLAALAHHFCEAAAMGDVDKAADYARRAGTDALEALAHEDATGHFTRGLDVLDEAGVTSGVGRAELLLGLAEARNRGADTEVAQRTAVEASNIARDLGDAELFARAALASATGTPPRPDTVTERLLEEAIRWLDEADSPLRSRVLSMTMRTISYLDNTDRRRQLSEEALVMARRTGDIDALLDALATRHEAIWGPTNVEERLAIADEMIALDRSVRGVGHVYRFADLFELGDIDGSRVALERLRLEVEQSREHGMVVWVDLWQTAIDLFCGRLEPAESGLMRWFSDHRGIPDDFALQCFGVQFFDLRRAQGRAHEVEPPVRALVEEHPENPAWRAGLAMLLTELDQRREVAALFEGLATDDFAAIKADAVGFTLNLALAAEACAYLGDADRAESLYKALLPYAGRNIIVGVGIVSIGPASRYLGLLATTMQRWDAAATHFDDALAMNTRMNARPWLARAMFDYAHMLRRSGRTEEARHLLTQASTLAIEIGMAVLSERVTALLD